MSGISRRHFVKAASAAAVSAAAIGGTAAASPAGSAVAQLEAALVEAKARHLAAIRFTDSVHGTPEEDAAYEAQSVACDSECEAEAALIDYEPRTPAELVEKARAMERLVDWDCVQEAAGPALVRDILAIAGRLS